MNEIDIISKYLRKLTKNNISSKNLNDDVFFDSKNKLVISVDSYNEKVHFPNINEINLVFKKIIRSSISDLICKGVNPKYYFMAVSANKNFFSKNKLKKIVKSLNDEQKKFKIYISGGDTSYAKKFSCTVTSLGFSSKIIERNKAKLGDDIYVTGNIGDSYIGLKILQKKKYTLSDMQKKYFIKKFYLPDLPFKFTNTLIKHANSSIDISDGLITDLIRLTNKQRYNFKIYTHKIPTSRNFDKMINFNNLSRNNFLFNGDDYQTIFTASKSKRKSIFKSSKSVNQKITIIGEITNKYNTNLLVDKKKLLNLNNYRGYLHKF